MAGDHQEPNREPVRSYSRNDDWRQREAVEDATTRAAETAVRKALDQVGVQVGGLAGREFGEDLAYLRRIRVRSQEDAPWQEDQTWVRRSRERESRDGETARSTGISSAVKALFYVISAALGAAVTAAISMFGVHR